MIYFLTPLKQAGSEQTSLEQNYLGVNHAGIGHTRANHAGTDYTGANCAGTDCTGAAKHPGTDCTRGSRCCRRSTRSTRFILSTYETAAQLLARKWLSCLAVAKKRRKAIDWNSPAHSLIGKKGGNKKGSDLAWVDLHSASARGGSQPRLHCLGLETWREALEVSTTTTATAAGARRGAPWPSCGVAGMSAVFRAWPPGQMDKCSAAQMAAGKGPRVDTPPR